MRSLATVKCEDKEFPIQSFVLGPEDKSCPTLALIGGVHGLERVGTHLILSYLEGLFEQWKWDQELALRFKDTRLVIIPMLNPGGMYLGTRSNPNGVDLMRNAPIEAKLKPAWLIGGHRWSKRLPYYRGVQGSEMEVESQALVQFVRDEVFPSNTSLVLDVHSGFGSTDRLWFPYAKTTDPFPRLEEVNALHEMLNRSYPNHVYQVEAQSLNYTTHGDLWDYLFDEHAEKFKNSGATFIPWTLEMGSWMWIKKNPTQLFSALGPFNPIKEHRIRRTMRRHLPLIDFFIRAVKSNKAWVKTP